MGTCALLGVGAQPATQALLGKEGCGPVSLCRGLGQQEELPLSQCPERALGAEPGPVRHFNPSYSTAYLGHDSTAVNVFQFLWPGRRQALTGAYLVFVFTPYLVPLRAGSAAAESRRAGWCVLTTAWAPHPLPKPRLKFPSAEVAVCLIAEVT